MINNKLLIIYWKSRFLVKFNKKITSIAPHYCQYHYLIISISKITTIFSKIFFSSKIKLFFSVYIYLYFYPGKNTLIIYLNKIRNFILIDNYFAKLIIIIWVCRFIKKYLIVFKYLSLLFLKYYLNKIPYLTYKNTFIEKKRIAFTYNKTRTYIEYQAYIRPYLGQYFNLIKHIQQFIINKLTLINSLRLDLLVFTQTKLTPRRFNLSFFRVKSNEDINVCFKKAFRNLMLALDDKYNDQFVANHISIRLYFLNIPTQMDLLFIENYDYYILNTKNDTYVELLVNNQIMNEKSSLSHKTNYHDTEINFYINDDEN